jgi:hypothetical protein
MRNLKTNIGAALAAIGLFALVGCSNVLDGAPGTYPAAAAFQLRAVIAGANARSVNPDAVVTYTYTVTNVTAGPETPLTSGDGIPLSAGNGQSILFSAYAAPVGAQAALVAKQNVTGINVSADGVISGAPVVGGTFADGILTVELVAEAGDGTLTFDLDFSGVASASKISLFEGADGTTPVTMTAGAGWTAAGVYAIATSAADVPALLTIAAGHYVVEIDLQGADGKVAFYKEGVSILKGLTTDIDWNPPIYGLPPIALALGDDTYKVVADASDAKDISYDALTGFKYRLAAGDVVGPVQPDIFDAPLVALVSALKATDTFTLNAAGEITAIAKVDTTIADSDISGSESLFNATAVEITGNATKNIAIGDAAVTTLTIAAGKVTTGAITGNVVIGSGSVAFNGTVTVASATGITFASGTAAITNVTFGGGTITAATSLAATSGAITGGGVTATGLTATHATTAGITSAVINPLLGLNGDIALTLNGATPALAGVSIPDGTTLTIGTGVTAGLASSSLTIEEGGTFVLTNTSLTAATVLAAGTYKATGGAVALASTGVFTFTGTLEATGTGITAAVASVGDANIETTLIKVTKGLVHVTGAVTFDTGFTPAPATGATVEYIFDTSFATGTAALGQTDKTITFSSSIDGGTATSIKAVEAGATTLTLGTGTVTPSGTTAITAGAVLDVGGATLVQTATTANDITLNGTTVKGTAITYPAGTVFDGTAKTITVSGTLTIAGSTSGVLNTGAATLIVGDTGDDAVTFTGATLTAGNNSSSTDGDITLDGSAGTVVFTPDTGGDNDTGSITLAVDGVVTIYGEGEVDFGGILSLENTDPAAEDQSNNPINGTFTAGSYKVTIAADSDTETSITGETTGSKLTLGANAKLAIAASNALTAKDVEIDVSATGAGIDLNNATSTFLLDVQAGGVVAKLTLSSTEGLVSGATGGSANGSATGVTSVVGAGANDITVAYSVQNAGSGGGLTITTGTAGGGDSANSADLVAGAALTAVGGVITITGHSSGSVLSTGSKIAVSAGA